MSTAGEELARAWQIHQAGETATAERVYRTVIDREPQNANAWCYLGIACHDLQRYDEAVAAYRQALRLQPQFPIALNNLGNTLRMQRRLNEALKCFDEALRLKPDYANAYKNKGTSLLWEGYIVEALACFQEALRVAPDDAESHKNVGVIRLLQGEFAEGWREYQWRERAVARLLPDIRLPRWTGESLAGRTILLVGEQGLGDTIQFVRYAAVLKQLHGCRVIVAVLRPLLTLLQSCAGIDQLVEIGDTLPPADVWLPLLSVPQVLGHNSTDQFPSSPHYLEARQDLSERWGRELSAWPGFKIGIAWAGSPQYQADKYRSFPLHDLLRSLGRLHGIHLFSLQKGVGLNQLERTDALTPVCDFGDRLDASGPFLDTAAVMSQLDLVISADTGVGHLAGALGVPCWLALSRVPDWRWMLERSDSPWYPATRLFRQTTMGDWTGVFEQMAETLLREQPAVRRKRPAEYRLATTGFNRLVQARHGLLLYNRHDRYIGGSLERYGEFSEGECDLFRQIVRPGAVVVEAGANIGSHTVALSAAVGPTGRVYAFEPQRIVFQTLCANVALNSLTNVDCRWQAVGAGAGTIVVPPLDYNQENNFGALGLGSYRQGETVPVVTVDSLGLERCDLLKADVEGMELEVLRGASQTLARCRPLLYLENDRQEKSAALLQHLLDLGYRLFWHLPHMFQEGNFYGNGDNAFRGIVSVNVLGVHESVKSNIVGLQPITSASDVWHHQAPPRTDSA